MKEGDRQRGRGNRLEQWVKGVGWSPVCWKCDSPMRQTSSQMYSTDYRCQCGQKWTDEWL